MLVLVLVLVLVIVIVIVAVVVAVVALDPRSEGGAGAERPTQRCAP
ncbi:MAG: hypothetical protein AB7N76_27550 [Planctomycetota bacterium]